MMLNVIHFLKNVNLKSRSHVSVTDMYLSERFGSVFFILLCELQCVA